MKIFIKLFWGFDPFLWPVISFSQKGSVDSLLKLSEPGDLMAFIGTKGFETAKEHRGKLIGLAEFGREQVHSQSALPQESFANAAKGADGDIKWPHAVRITRAWRFIDYPLPNARQVLGWPRLPMSTIKNAVLLSAVEQQNILMLAREEIDVGFTQAVREEREKIAAAIGPGGTMGPIPASFTTTLHRNIFQEAFTYAYQFGNRDVWKVGWAHNPAARLAELNRHVPSEALGESWGGGWTKKWPSADLAYDLEQRVLQSFANSNVYGERIHCAKEKLQNVWATFEEKIDKFSLHKRSKTKENLEYPNQGADARPFGKIGGQA